VVERLAAKASKVHLACDVLAVQPAKGAAGVVKVKALHRQTGQEREDSFDHVIIATQVGGGLSTYS